MKYYSKICVSCLFIIFSIANGKSQKTADINTPVNQRSMDDNQSTGHGYNNNKPATLQQPSDNKAKASLPDYAPPIIAAEYFIDKDPGVGNGINLNVIHSDSININKKFETNPNLMFK